MLSYDTTLRLVVGVVRARYNNNYAFYVAQNDAMR